MKLLSNGCKRSEINVLPKNWETTTSIKKDWIIYYRFYDNILTGRGTQYPKGKQVRIGGMNEFKTAAERRDFALSTIEEIKLDLEKRDYNPITGYRKKLEDEKTDYIIDPNSALTDALQKAFEMKQAAKSTKVDLKSVLKYSVIAAKNIKLATMPVKEVRRRHIKAILEECGRIKKEKWTNHNYNFYRSYLMMLFDELCEWEVIEHNPIDDRLSIRKHTARKRPILTDEQRVAIDDDLRQNNYRFWLFMRIFFLSGARETEMMLVQKKDVNLKSQMVKYTILKGNNYHEDERPIPDNAINFWEQALTDAAPNDYLFAKGLKPGPVPICAHQISRRWRTWIKKKVNEKGERIYPDVADFYSLKHSHSTEVSRQVGRRLAALHNKHTEAILKSSYDIEGKERDMEILKSIEVSFT